MNWHRVAWGMAGAGFVVWALAEGSWSGAFLAGFMARGAIDDFRLASRGRP